MAVPSLFVRNLTKSFGEVAALRDVSFGVGQGEIFGYLGPNGAGKTTTLRIIVRLIRADSGRVELFGKATLKSAVRLQIGYLPGDLRLYGEMRSDALLDYFAGFRRRRPPVLRKRLLDVLQVDGTVLSRRAKFLSHGTRQKLGLIIALQHDPALILLDEPTTGLDPLVQRAFREFLLDRAHHGRAILFSSHILSEVEAVCGRVGILRAGRLVTVEAVEGLLSRTVRRMQVRFRDEIPGDLASVPGVTSVDFRGREGFLWIKGDVNPIVRRLAQTQIEHFVFPEPELEDIFLTYYQQANADRHA